MKRLKKIVLVLFVLFVLVIVGGAVIAASMIEGIVKKGVETVGPRATRASVTLDSVELSAFSGAGALNHFSVGNPEGFKTEHAMQVDRIRMQVSIPTVLRDVIIIEEIKVVGAEFTYELGLGESNIGVLQKNIEQYVAELTGGGAGDTGEPSGDGTGDGGAPAENAKPQKKVIIRHFITQDCKVRLSSTLLQGAAVPLPLPDLHLTDIGQKSNGATIAQALDQTLKPIFAAIGDVIAKSKELIEKMDLDGKLKGAGGIVEDAGKKIKNIFGK